MNVLTWFRNVDRRTLRLEFLPERSETRTRNNEAADNDGQMLPNPREPLAMFHLVRIVFGVWFLLV